MEMRKLLEEVGLKNLGEIKENLCASILVENALKAGEGVLSKTGALSVRTGKYTGRSPHDRFFVETPIVKDAVDWGEVNKPISVENYEKVRKYQQEYLVGKDVYVFEGFVGKNPRCRKAVRVVTEYAWQGLFSRQLLVRPTEEELANFKPDVTIIAAPGCKVDKPEEYGLHSEAFVILNLDDNIILIGGTSYAGEIKKSCFTYMNFFMPMIDVAPMHCSANIGPDGKTALFFGLSGTGKTTLSADPERSLIGDDEHGWSDEGIFNFEGGCYAKCIRLSKEGEPQIWDAIKFGSVIENVILDEETRTPDFDDGTLTENTRAGYPIEYIPNAELTGMGGQPSAIIFLTADAFGVLPPISKLDTEQASYHYLSGYTSKLAGTERGITEPVATFSAGFGAPFLPRAAGVYAGLLKERILKYQPDVFLVNTGWTGGSYGTGSRMKLKYTRAMVKAALNGELRNVKTGYNEIFNLHFPLEIPGVPSEILDPRSTWENKEEYDKTAKHLADLFKENIKKLHGVTEETIAAGPR